MATDEEKFQAAVNVIRAMPKKGPFQPSPDLMLKFYAYFKQATEGPCTQAKPSFWEVIAKAKWDAWKKLGTTSKSEAMRLYVHELKQVAESVLTSDSFSTAADGDTSADGFVQVVLPFYKAAYEDGDYPKLPDSLKHLSAKFKPKPEENLSKSVAEPEPEPQIQTEISEDTRKPEASNNESSEDETYEDPLEENNILEEPASTVSTISEDIGATISQLEKDMALIKDRVQLLGNLPLQEPTVEQRAVDKVESETIQPVVKRPSSSLIPFKDLSFSTSLVIVLWPLMTLAVLNKFGNIQRRR